MTTGNIISDVMKKRSAWLAAAAATLLAEIKKARRYFAMPPK